MRCTAYCTASAYSIQFLFSALKAKSNPSIYKDVVHVPVERKDGICGDAFYFSFGATVFWGLNEEEEHAVLEELKPFEEGALTLREFDELTYGYGPTFKIHQDEITLADSSSLAKLAVSYGIAQSVKLAIFEHSIRETIEKTRPLTQNLVKKGAIALSRKDIAKKIGELFIERNSINLHWDVLDTPEFFWEYPELDLLYRTTANYLDVITRVDVLNKRLDIVRELLEMLGSQLNHQHSSALEWIIIILIIMEVILALSRDFLHIF